MSLVSLLRKPCYQITAPMVPRINPGHPLAYGLDGGGVWIFAHSAPVIANGDTAVPGIPSDGVQELWTNSPTNFYRTAMLYQNDEYTPSGRGLLQGSSIGFVGTMSASSSRPIPLRSTVTGTMVFLRRRITPFNEGVGVGLGGGAPFVVDGAWCWQWAFGINPVFAFGVNQLVIPYVQRTQFSRNLPFDGIKHAFSYLETWVLVGGRRGMSAWLNGVKLASSSTPVTRTASGPWVAGPNQEFFLIAYHNAEWTDEQVLEYTQDPFCYLRDVPMLAGGMAVPIVAPPATTGTLIVQKVTSPVDPQLFDFTVDGGLSPGTFSLANGQAQIFNDVPPGVYAVTETPVGGWDSALVVSNGDPASAINIAAGATVFVTANNTSTTPPPPPPPPESICGPASLCEPQRGAARTGV